MARRKVKQQKNVFEAEEVKENPIPDEPEVHLASIRDDVRKAYSISKDISVNKILGRVLEKLN